MVNANQSPGGSPGLGNNRGQIDMGQLCRFDDAGEWAFGILRRYLYLIFPIDGRYVMGNAIPICIPRWLYDIFNFSHPLRSSGFVFIFLALIS